MQIILYYLSVVWRWYLSASVAKNNKMTERCCIKTKQKDNAWPTDFRIWRKSLPIKYTYFAAVYCIHFNKAFLALPWTLVTTFRLLGGLAVSELTTLSTEEALLDNDCSCGRLLVSSSICREKNVNGLFVDNLLNSHQFLKYFPNTTEKIKLGRSYD